MSTGSNGVTCQRSPTVGLTRQGDNRAMPVPITDMWMIRAGEGGNVLHHFLAEGVAYIGWGVGPIYPTDSNASIRQRVCETHHETASRLPNVVGMLRRFSCEVRVGDVMVTYDPQCRLYHVGIVKSDAFPQIVPWVDFATGDDFEEDGYVRDVDWVSAVSRDALSPATRRSIPS